MTETNLSPRPEPDYTYLAELIYKSQFYPPHLLVTRGERDLQTGHYVQVANQSGTVAHLEAVMREGAEQGKKPLESVYTSQPRSHVFKNEYITEDQYLVISASLTDEAKPKFLEYMGVGEVQQIKAKDYAKAVNALETAKKAKK